MVGVEAEGFAGAVRVGDAEQTLAAEVDVEAGVLQRPVGGHLDAGEGEIDGAVPVRPGCAMGVGLAVERPAFERNLRADGPEVEFEQPLAQAVGALPIGKCHHAFP